jgi:hypothetical protein
VDAQVAHDAPVLRGLDALGDQRGPEDLRDLEKCAQSLHFLRTLAETRSEILVDLHDVGLGLRPQAQARAAIAEVVQCQHHSRRVDGPRRPVERRYVAHMLMFGDLDHQHARPQTERVDGAGDRIDGPLAKHLQQRGRAQVDEQPPGLPHPSPCLQSDADAGNLEVRVTSKSTLGPSSRQTTQAEPFDRAVTRRRAECGHADIDPPRPEPGHAPVTFRTQHQDFTR